MEIFGWLSMICFWICSFPELMACRKKGYCSIAWGTILLWLVGEFFGICYAISLHAIPLTANYGVCFLLTLPLAYYKLKGK